LAGAAAGAVLWLAPLVAEQGTRLAPTLAGLYLDGVEALQQAPSRLVRRLAGQLPGQMTIGPEAGEAGSGMGAAVTQLVAYLGLIGDGLFIFVAVQLLAFYWTLDRERITRSLLLLLPSGQREGVRALFLASEAKVGGYIRGVAGLCLIVGALATAAYWLIGLPNALLLGLAAALFEAVPVVGPALGALPAIVVALSVDPVKAVGVLAATAAIQILENTILVPRVMGHAVGVNPVVTLLALAAFGGLFGLPGALMAIPLAAVIQLLLDRFVLGPRAVEAQALPGRGRVSVLRYEARQVVADARSLLRHKPEAVPDDGDGVEDAIEALAADLDSLLARAVPEDEAPGRSDGARRPAQSGSRQA
jgi:predicted PurR-regulated permease PerM